MSQRAPCAHRALTIEGEKRNMTLDKLKVGAYGVIEAVGGEGALRRRLLDMGLKIMIGKGKRSPAVIDAIKRNKAVYLIAVGGAAALIKSRITECEEIAYPDLGCEAVRRIVFDRLPLLVAIDAAGNNILK